MKTNKIITTIIFSIFVNIIFAQNITVKEDINIDEYPNISFKINVYNPDIKNKNNFSLKENDQEIDFEVEHIQNQIENKSKAILILFEDMTHSTHFGQRKKCRYILEKSIPNFVKNGDKINMAVFDRNRDGSTPLRFVLNEYTNDTALLIQKVNSFKTITDNQSKQKSSDLYNAIYDGINELKTKYPKQNKILLVFSAGKNLIESNYNSIETLNQFAKKEKVAVYSIQYMIWEHENIDVLTSESFGKKFHIQGSYKIKGDHSKEKASDTLSYFMNNAVERLYGHDYKITYKSTFKKDGDLHRAILSVDNKPETIQFKTPNCNFICKFKNNMLLYGSIILSILLIIFVIIFQIVKQKKLKQLLQQKVNEEHEEKIRQQNIDIERIEKENADKLAEQQYLIEKEKKERQQAENENQYKLEQEKSKEENRRNEENLISLMQQTGGFPKLRANIDNTNSEFEINKPEIIIGRASSNDFVLNNNYISGQHCKIFFIDSEYFIEDLNSSNGTKLNGNDITQAKLTHNDIIEVGNAKIMFIH